MDTPTPNFRLRDVAKSPLVYALMILGMLVGALFFAYTNSNSAGLANCERTNTTLWAQHDSDRNQINRLNSELAIARGIITQLKPTVDSLIHNK